MKKQLSLASDPDSALNVAKKILHLLPQVEQAAKINLTNLHKTITTLTLWKKSC